MKHASAETLLRLAGLLAEIRKLGLLREPKLGTFYRKSSAFLHFHDDPAGTFADVKHDLLKFTRMPVDTPAEQAALLAAIRDALDSP